MLQGFVLFLLFCCASSIILANIKMYHDDTQEQNIVNPTATIHHILLPTSTKFTGKIATQTLSPTATKKQIRVVRPKSTPKPNPIYTFTSISISSPTNSVTPIPTHTFTSMPTSSPTITPPPTLPPTATISNHIQTPEHPFGATARCNDGTYSHSKNNRGTCSHHKGVDQWLPQPQIAILIEKCDTGFDILHGLGEVTNAYVNIKNVGSIDIPNFDVELLANDVEQEHADQLIKVESPLRTGQDTSLKLTADTTIGEDTLITISVKTVYGILKQTQAISCKELEEN